MLDWFDKLRSEGRLDSSGRFTIDLARAQEILGRYTQVETRQHLQNLVAAAVARGATQWDLTQTGEVVSIQFDGPPATAEELMGMFESLALDPEQPSQVWLRWLALGVAGAAREARRITLESALGVRLVIQGSRRYVEPCPVGGAPNRILIQYANTLLQRWLVGPARERQGLTGCRFAPIPIRVQGLTINQPFSLLGIGTTLVQGSSRLGTLLTPGGVRRRSSDSALTCAFTLGSNRPGVWLNVLGVTIELMKRLPYHSRVLIAHDEVALDASRLHVPEREQKRIFALVVEELKRTRAELAQEGPGKSERRNLVSRLRQSLG